MKINGVGNMLSPNKEIMAFNLVCNGRCAQGCYEE